GQGTDGARLQRNPAGRLISESLAVSHFLGSLTTTSQRASSGRESPLKLRNSSIWVANVSKPGRGFSPSMSAAPSRSLHHSDLRCKGRLKRRREAASSVEPVGPGSAGVSSASSSEVGARHDGWGKKLSRPW